MRNRTPHLLLAAALTLGACDDDGVSDPASTLTSEEATDLALEVAELGYGSLDAAFGEAAFATNVGAAPATASPDTVIHQFERTRPCPLGGAIVVAGTSTGEVDREAHHVVIETEATTTHQACVLQLRRARQVELNGSPNVAMSSRFERQDGMPLGPQTISYDGAVAWQVLDSDRAGVCEVHLDIVWERTESGGHRTVDGTVCQREIHSETTWTRHDH